MCCRSCYNNVLGCLTAAVIRQDEPGCVKSPCHNISSTSSPARTAGCILGERGKLKSCCFVYSIIAACPCMRILHKCTELECLNNLYCVSRLAYTAAEDGRREATNFVRVLSKGRRYVRNGLCGVRVARPHLGTWVSRVQNSCCSFQPRFDSVERYV